MQEKEKANKNEENERGGLRVASLRCGVFAARGGRAMYRVSRTEYPVLDSQAANGRETSKERTSKRNER